MQEKSQGVQEKNQRGWGARILQGMHTKKFRRAPQAEKPAPPGQMSVSAPDRLGIMLPPKWIRLPEWIPLGGSVSAKI